MNNKFWILKHIALEMETQDLKMKILKSINKLKSHLIKEQLGLI